MSGIWAGDGGAAIVDVPLAMTSAADMVLVDQVGVDGLECLIAVAMVLLRDGLVDF